MTIKQQGGIFGRNPTFNDVDIEGTLTVNGEPISDFGTMATQDASSVAITGGSGAFDTFTVDTDTLYVDAPSDRVGINTSSPTTALQVNTGAGGFGTFMHTSGVGGLRISGAAGASGANLVLANNFNTALDDRWAFSLNGGTDALSIASGGVASGLGGSGTERVTVDTSGNMSLKTGNLVVASGKASTSLPPLALAQVNCSMTMKRGRGRLSCRTGRTTPRCLLTAQGLTPKSGA
jgi:hypothetical protein